MSQSSFHERLWYNALPSFAFSYKVRANYLGGFTVPYWQGKLASYVLNVKLSYFFPVGLSDYMRRDTCISISILLICCFCRFWTDYSNLMICPLFASLPHAQQLAAFQAAPSGCRKIILATNIAETSVTIPNVKYVVDCGMVKSKGQFEYRLVGKKKAFCRSVFLTRWHCILSNELTKNTLLQTVFLAILTDWVISCGWFQWS